MNLLNPLLKTARPLFAALAVVAALGLAACDDKDTTQPKQQTTTQNSSPSTSTPGQAATPSQATPVVLPQGEASLDDNDYIVFDGSGSMNACVDRKGREYSCRGGETPKIVGAKTAVTAAISPLPDSVHLGLYVFDYYKDSERLPLAANNKAQFLALVDKIYAGNGTPLGPAMDKGIDALTAQYKKQLGYGTYRLIVVTDGMPDSMYSVERAIEKINKSGVPIQIYTIGFGMDDPNHPLRKASVTFTAAYNGQEVETALQKAVSSETESFDPTDFQK